MKARLLHFLELSIRPIKVANSFAWDEIATKHFRDEQSSPKRSEQLQIKQTGFLSIGETFWDNSDVFEISARWVPLENQPN